MQVSIKTVFRVVALATAMCAPSAFAQVTTSGNLPPGIVATQNGQQVSLQDIDAYAAKIPENDRVGFFDSPKRIESAIRSILLQKQLAAEARAAKLDQDPAVQNRVRLAVDDTLANAELVHWRAAMKLPDFAQLAQEYYAAHKDEFDIPGAIEAKHILVSTKERGDEAAKARIGEVAAAANAHPEQFDALVAKYSDDPSKEKNHGVIADAGGARMARPFADAAKNLEKPGELSPIVKTSYGYHILQLVSRQPSTPKSFADVRDQIIKKLRDNYITTELEQHTGDLRGKPLDANPDLVASLRTRYLKEGQILPSEVPAQMQAEREAAKSGDAQH
jgi:parvulin-like peptidyl-prolyl isomerase